MDSPAGPHASAPSRFTLAVAPDAASLARHRAAWEDLAAHALEPGSRHEPLRLLPAMDRLGAQGGVLVVLAYRGTDSAIRLDGLFPLERAARHGGSRLRHVRPWRYEECASATPLLRRGHARECLAEFHRWLAHDPRGCAVIAWEGLDAGSPFFQLLSRDLDEARRLSCFQVHQGLPGELAVVSVVVSTGSALGDLKVTTLPLRRWASGKQRVAA